MTRQANPNSTAGFNVKSRDESEKKIVQALKKLAVQDEVEISELVFEGLLLMLRKHNIDVGGNPNRQLASFDENFKPPVFCKCGKPAVKHGVHMVSKVERDYCSKCFCGVLGRHDPKVWRFSDC